jgi:hypothetical protein
MLNAEHGRASCTALRTQTVAGIVGDDAVGDISGDWTVRSVEPYSAAADEVIAHLTGLVGSNVTVTLEIEANVPNGMPNNVVRTVTENSRTLKFKSHGFEKE